MAHDVRLDDAGTPLAREAGEGWGRGPVQRVNSIAAASTIPPT